MVSLSKAKERELERELVSEDLLQWSPRCGAAPSDRHDPGSLPGSLLPKKAEENLKILLEEYSKSGK